MADNEFTTQEVADALSLSDGYIRQMIASGLARPKRKFGDTWLFTADEIERLRNRPISKGGRPKKKVEATE
jgi:excisionase family DNA binding protein